MALFKRRFKAPQLESMDDFTELTSNGKPLLVDFYKRDCQPCRVMDGIVDEIAEEFEDRANVVKVNLDVVPDLFYKFKIKSTPTFIVLNPREDGLHQRWRHSGLVKKDALADHVTKAIGATES
ncbi:MAG: thioredoxin family protein [Acidimicrobiia bacterium]